MLHVSRARLLCRLTACLFVFLYLAVPLSAQTGLGVVRGTATDPTGAVLPNASVTLTNTVTGVALKTQSSDVGAFYFGSVRPGPYTIAITATGFKKWSGNLQLDVG